MLASITSKCKLMVSLKSFAVSQNGTMATHTPRKKAPAPAAYHHGDLRNALVREGRRSLEENGAGELSLREVARRLGVSVAAPSRHFATVS